MVLSVIAYCLGSWIALKAGWCKPYNLDKLFHRGEYADEAEKARLAQLKGKKISILSRIVGIDNEYTLGDKIIAWSVFCYSIIYRLGLAFFAVLLWNVASPWPSAWWGKYYYVTHLIIPIIVGCVSTVWFLWGASATASSSSRTSTSASSAPPTTAWCRNRRGPATPPARGFPVYFAANFCQ